MRLEWHLLYSALRPCGFQGLCPGVQAAPELTGWFFGLCDGVSHRGNRSGENIRPLWVRPPHAGSSVPNALFTHQGPWQGCRERASSEMGDFRSTLAISLFDSKLITFCKSYAQHYIVNGIYKFIQGAPRTHRLLKNASPGVRFWATCTQISLVKSHNVSAVLALRLSFTTTPFPRLLCSLSSSFKNRMCTFHRCKSILINY